MKFFSRKRSSTGYNCFVVVVFVVVVVVVLVVVLVLVICSCFLSLVIFSREHGVLRRL
jgi:hypothetical protein